MSADNIPGQQDGELDWQTQPWADDVRDLIERSGKSFEQIVELLNKMDLRFFS